MRKTIGFGNTLDQKFHTWSKSTTLYIITSNFKFEIPMEYVLDCGMFGTPTTSHIKGHNQINQIRMNQNLITSIGPISYILCRFSNSTLPMALPI